MTKSPKEVVRLRISVARIAQAAGMTLDTVGLTDDADYNAIRAAAETYERGWNTLAGEIVRHLDLLRKAFEQNP
jgi:hypothetical protein